MADFGGGLNRQVGSGPKALLCPERSLTGSDFNNLAILGSFVIRLV